MKARIASSALALIAGFCGTACAAQPTHGVVVHESVEQIDRFVGNALVRQSPETPLWTRAEVLVECELATLVVMHRNINSTPLELVADSLAVLGRPGGAVIRVSDESGNKQLVEPEHRERDSPSSRRIIVNPGERFYEVIDLGQYFDLQSDRTYKVFFENITVEAKHPKGSTVNLTAAPLTFTMPKCPKELAKRP